MSPPFDLMRRASELQISVTLNKVAQMAGGLPLNLAIEGDLKAGLSTSLVDFCEAVDRQEISFHTPGSMSGFYRMAVLAH